MARQFILAGALLGGLATLVGAFGSHVLEGMLGPERLSVFEIGVRYQFYHALALLLTGLLATRSESRALRWAGRLFVFGTIAFSFSLYVLALTGIHWFGPITPIGGTALAGAWFLVAAHAFRSRSL